MAKKDIDASEKIVNIMSRMKDKKDRDDGVVIHIDGKGNAVAGRDININKREVHRVEYVPDDRHISPETAKKIQDKVKKLAEIEMTAGATSRQAYGRWYGAIKGRFDVPSYKLIPEHLGQDALDWLTQQRAIARPRLRRTDNTKWRNDHYKAIWAKSREMGMSKAEVYHVVHVRIGKRVNSLKQLGERDLKKLYNIINGMYRNYKSR